MLPKITIIVPTYNVEKYIAKCLDSLVNQDYENFDVLVINDGSPYNEQVIIDDYSRRYPSIVKSIKKENGGYGSALETGFQNTDAEYVLVCDPDDYIEPNALSKLYQYMKDTNSDLVVGAKNLVYSDNSEVKYDKSYNDEFGELEDHKEYIKGTKEFEMLYFLEPSPHSKLYRRDVVKNIVFPHKVSFTDNLLYFYALSKANRVAYCKEPLSYYLINREGNTATDLKPTIIDGMITAFKSIVSQVKDANDIFYYRMFESFYFIYYKVDEIKGDKKVKKDKYNLVYSFLEELIPYKNQILNKVKEYGQDSDTMYKQKEALLTKETSKETFDKLVDNRINPSMINKLKNKLFK